MQFLTDDFAYSHKDVNCGKQEYVDYLTGPGYGSIKQTAPEGPGAWREWLAGVKLQPGDAGTHVFSCFEKAQRFAHGRWLCYVVAHRSGLSK